jgi:methionine synthase I (cobalamin-dependent)
VRTALAVVVVGILAGCGVPQEPSKQAEEVHSIAAEGALLAHDAAEGSTTETFTREHAKALGKRIETLDPAIEELNLAQIAADVYKVLTVLAERPGDRELAETFERVLENHAHAAEELAG